MQITLQAIILQLLIIYYNDYNMFIIFIITGNQKCPKLTQ